MPAGRRENRGRVPKNGSQIDGEACDLAQSKAPQSAGAPQRCYEQPDACEYCAVAWGNARYAAWPERGRYIVQRALDEGLPNRDVRAHRFVQNMSICATSGLQNVTMASAIMMALKASLTW